MTDMKINLGDNVQVDFFVWRRAKVRVCPRPWQLFAISECALWNLRWLCDLSKTVKWERCKRLNDNALLVEKLYRISARKQNAKEVQKMREKENAWLLLSYRVLSYAVIKCNSAIIVAFPTINILTIRLVFYCSFRDTILFSETNQERIRKWKKVLTFFSYSGIISLVVSKKTMNPIWNAEVSELADEQD